MATRRTQRNTGHGESLQSSQMVPSDEGEQERQTPSGQAQPPQSGGAAAAAAAADDDSGGAVVSAKQEKARWTPDCAETLPRFDLVRQNRRTIEQWCQGVKAVTQEYWGPTGLIVASLVAATNLTEFSLDSFDKSEYNVDTFLQLVTASWNQGQGRGQRKPLLAKKPSEPWLVYLDRLQGWAARNELKPSNEWFLNQLRANVEMGQDVLRDKKDVSPVEWARTMDAQLATYANGHAEPVTVKVNEVALGSESDSSGDEARVPITVVRRGDSRVRSVPKGQPKKHLFAEDGTPICDLCKVCGHMARDCPRKRGGGRYKRGKRLVYSVEDGASNPIVISVSVFGQELNAMLDSGAMENVIDGAALKRFRRRVRLQKFTKTLIGADKKKISVLGAASLPVKVEGKTKSINCVAVRNLNTDFIIGLPGLKALGVKVDFGNSKVWVGDSLINSIGVVDPQQLKPSAMECTIDPALPEDKREEMYRTIDKWQDTLVESIQDRGPAKGYTFSIPTGDTKPIYVPLRTYSPKEQEELDRQIDDMLAKHIITRTRSPWSAPVLLVRKKDDTYRVVVDYTRLNAKTDDDPFPLPVPRKAFQVLNEARFYSSIDLASGYWQLALAEEDVPKTAFNTRKGTFAFLRMPMGLKGAPSAFQRYMTEIFSDLLYQGVLVFIDDILIYTDTWEKHVKLVDEVLHRLSAHNLQAKMGKCHFGAQEVKYLGSVISYQHRKPDPDKVKAIQELQPPSCKDDIRSVMGLVGFYREFIPNLAALAEPLQKLMRKDVKFEWGQEQQQAFESIKSSISENSCLEIPVPEWSYELHTDASLSGIGAVLFQRDPSGKLHTIEFASKALSKAQRKQAIPVLECYAIVWALKKFRCYIHGVHVDVYSDHYGLQFMKQKKDPPAQIQRWWWDIADYDFEIFYKKGKKNIADPLSRLMPQSQLDEEDEHDMELIACIARELEKRLKVVEILERRTRGHRREYLVRWNDPEGPKTWETRFGIKNNNMVDRFDKDWDAKERMQQEEALREHRLMTRDEVLKEQQIDPECCEIRRALAGEEVTLAVSNDAKQCVELDGALYHKDARRKSVDGQLQLVMPKAFRKDLIKEVHGGVLGGHFGVQRTLDAVKRHYWWHGMKKDVQGVVEGCPNCNARNAVRGASKPLLQPEARTAVPWERVGIDFTDMAKTPEGYSKLLVMIDHATKFVIARPTKDGSAQTAAKGLFEDLICRYGAPTELWSDRGKPFIGEIAKFLADLYHIKRKFTSGYHPQTNGLTERFNRTINNELAKVLNPKKDDWPNWLQAKVFAYNTSAQKSTGYSPFELLHTFTPRTPIDVELVPPSDSFKDKDWALNAFEKAKEMREDALKNQQAAALSQRKTHDKGLKPTEFNVGDYVRVYDPTAEAKEPVKFRNQWIGPFRLRGKKGMLWELEDLHGARIKGLFHPIKLKEVNAEMET